MDDASFAALTKVFTRLLQGARISSDPLPPAKAGQPPFICGAFSPDGTMIALSGGGRIPSRPAIWIARVPSFDTVMVIRGHQGVHDLAWDPASGLLASASNDYTCVMWAVEQGDHLFVIGGDHEPIVKGHVAFGNGALYIGETEAFADHRARLLRVSLDASLTTLRRLDKGMSIDHLAVDGDHWAIVEDDFHYRGKPRLVVDGNEQPIAGRLHAIGWHAGELAQLASDDEGLELRVGRERRRIDGEAPKPRASFSPDGSAVAIGGTSRVRIVDTGSGATTCAFDLGKPMVLAWWKKLLCAANADAIAVVDTNTGETVASAAPPAWFQ